MGNFKKFIKSFTLLVFSIQNLNGNFGVSHLNSSLELDKVIPRNLIFFSCVSSHSFKQLCFNFYNAIMETVGEG
jgi:hypothetical protein